MSKGRLPGTTLTLLYQFELDRESTAHRVMAGMDHDAAARKAAVLSKLCAPSQVAARGRVMDAPVDLARVHALPFDQWCTQNAAAVLLELVFATDSKGLCVRVTTDVAHFDGVLASRLLFHTLEVLEGNPVDSAWFKTNPPFRYGWRNAMNAVTMLVVTTADVAVGATRYYGLRLRSRLTATSHGVHTPLAPSSPAAIMQSHRSSRRELPVHRLFAPGGVAFDELLALLEAWKKRLGKNGFFYLLNFGSTISPGMTGHARDLTSLHARYRGVLQRPGRPPTGRIWRLLEYAASRKIFFNNYGRHRHTFVMKPVGFGWDWIDLVETLTGCGVITINGHLFCWFRALRRSLDEHGDLFTHVLGEPVGEFVQATHFPGTRPGQVTSDS